MPVELISATHITPAPSAHRHNLAGFDPDCTRRFARVLDGGGFDWTLIAYFSGAPDSLQLAQFVAENTERIAPVVAHRPRFTFPTQFARGSAGLGRISDGRVMIHIISGGSDAEQRREGDSTNKEQRYRRSEEFVNVLRRVWNSFRPIVAPTGARAWEKATKILAQGQGSTTALVGSYETVAAALIDYAEIGCDLLSIRGWDVFEDAQDYARHVLPLVRQELAHRAATGRSPVLNPDSKPTAVPAVA
ncbi:MAG TPA: LLM class flavin-dependent oxidoreductase [Baekduia sp.]|nr:LLM class flavin-dependent oxidoreductase [Baekduia sp.]